MSSDRLKMPPQRDLSFYQRKKHDKWREVAAPSPALEVSVADSHAHLHMMPDPAWELVRCAANRVNLVSSVADPSEDDMAQVLDIADIPGRYRENPGEYLSATDEDLLEKAGESGKIADVLLTVGVHPHNARLYSDELERKLVGYLKDPRVRVLGEIGLDYHYDFSPREVQRDVFRRQIQLAHELHMPIALHLRSGEGAKDEVADTEDSVVPVAGVGEAACQTLDEATNRATGLGDAHREAFGILQEEGFPQAGTLLHCCALSPDELQPWIDAGCYIAYGGAVTFKNADEARAGARIVPADRLLLETDAPYMTPEPMRGAACTPAHVIFTAQDLAETRGEQPGESRRDFLQQIRRNTDRFLGKTREDRRNNQV